MDQLSLFRIEGPPESGGKQAAKTGQRNGRVKKVPVIPPEVIVAAVELMGAIDLDPYCVDETATLVPAKVHLGIDAKALTISWGPKKRRVFLTPPAGRATATWIKKLCEEYEAGNVGQAITYLRAALDSEWWERLLVYPICIVHRQLRVAAGVRSTTTPWAVVYLGTNVKGFARAFNELGMLYVPYKRQTGQPEANANKKAAAERPEVREPEAGGAQIIQQGDCILTVHSSAGFVTLANPNWDSQDHNRLRNDILEIPGILPRQYSSVSRSPDGTVKLVFSFKKGQAENVISQIQKMLIPPPTKPGRGARVPR